jgi:hypothetical protein
MSTLSVLIYLNFKIRKLRKNYFAFFQVHDPYAQLELVAFRANHASYLMKSRLEQRESGNKKEGILAVPEHDRHQRHIFFPEDLAMRYRTAVILYFSRINIFLNRYNSMTVSDIHIYTG